MAERKKEPFWGFFILNILVAGRTRNQNLPGKTAGMNPIINTTLAYFFFVSMA
jgi:hypothetical protein